MSELPLSPAGDAAELALADEAATLRLAGLVARAARAGDVLGLAGDLGAGKTTFARGFIRALAGAGEEVPSPTFTLVQTYESPAGPIHHFDLFRLERPEDAWELGIEEAFADGISLIEWPERLGPLLPDGCLVVRLRADPAAGPGARRAALRGGAAWRARLRRIRRAFAEAAGG